MDRQAYSVEETTHNHDCCQLSDEFRSVNNRKFGVPVRTIERVI